MRFYGLDLNLIVALEAILRLRSVTGAAKELSLTQSAMSHSLARLREHYEDDITAQIGRELVPTPLGERLEVLARQFLSEARLLTQMRQTFDPATATREFTIICSDYVTEVFLCNVARKLAEIAPGITLRCVAVDRLAGEMFKRGEIDFRIGPEVVLEPDFPSLELFTDTFQAIADTNNADIGETLDLETYLSARHVATAFGADRQESHLERFLRSKRHSIQVALHLPTFSSIPQAVARSPFIGTIHSRLLAHRGKNLPLQAYVPPIEIPPLVQFLEWHPTRNHDIAADWIRNLLDEMADDMGPPPPV